MCFTFRHTDGPSPSCPPAHCCASPCEAVRQPISLPLLPDPPGRCSSPLLAPSDKIVAALLLWRTLLLLMLLLQPRLVLSGLLAAGQAAASGTASVAAPLFGVALSEHPHCWVLPGLGPRPNDDASDLEARSRTRSLAVRMQRGLGCLAPVPVLLAAAMACAAKTLSALKLCAHAPCARGQVRPRGLLLCAG